MLLFSLATNHEDGERFQTMNIHVRLDSTSSQKRSDSNSGPFNCLPKAGRASGKIEDSYKTLDRLRVTFTLPRSVRAGEEVRSKLRMDNWRDFDAFSVFVDVECRAKIFLEGQEDGSKENLAYFQRYKRASFKLNLTRFVLPTSTFFPVLQTRNWPL